MRATPSRSCAIAPAASAARGFPVEVYVQSAASGSASGVRMLNAGADARLVNSAAWFLKDALDWGSRPNGNGPMRQKPVAIMGCATGMVGTRRAQLHLRSICTALDLWDMKKPEITVAGAASKFDSEGILTDEETRDQLNVFLEAFAVWIARFRS